MVLTFHWSDDLPSILRRSHALSWEGCTFLPFCLLNMGDVSVIHQSAKFWYPQVAVRDSIHIGTQMLA